MTFGITIKPAKTFGNRPDSGRSPRYAREDHDHGTPDMTTEAVTPVIPYATTVAEQKDFGLPSQVGTDQRLARADHQHGTPDFDPADKEDVTNKVASWTATTTDTHYPSEKLVKDSLDGKEDDSNKVTSWTATTTDIHYPSEKLVKDSIDALLPIDFYPSSMVVNTGTLDGGTVASLSLLDGTLVSISEVTGADPLRVTFSFTGVTRLSAFAFYGYYAGSPSHQLSVEIYNPNTTGWDVLGVVGSEASAQWYSFTIHNEETYIDGGAVSTRIRHIQNGIATHDLFLDYLELNYGAVGGSASISASSVTFTPFGNISATNVGSALVELDSEKQATLVSASNIKTINSNSLLGSGDIVITGTGEMNVQADWTQADNAQDDYIKNKPTSLPASDVSAWAKAATKPTYTAAEVGAMTISQIASLVSIRF
jgi:hypothetical protein